MEKSNSGIVNTNGTKTTDVTSSPSTDEQGRQLALGKISRRYVAYVVPAALAVLSNQASAGPVGSPL